MIMPWGQPRWGFFPAKKVTASLHACLQSPSCHRRRELSLPLSLSF